MPCAPTNVTAQRICGNSSVEVSWLASRGAQSYVAVAVGESGHRTSCSSNTTTCSMLDLHCSSVYSISLTAVDGNCSSLESQSVTLRTGEGCLGGGVNLNTQYYIYLDVKDIKKT